MKWAMKWLKMSWKVSPFCAIGQIIAAIGVIVYLASWILYIISDIESSPLDTTIFIFKIAAASVCAGLIIMIWPVIWICFREPLKDLFKDWSWKRLFSIFLTYLSALLTLAALFYTLLSVYDQDYDKLAISLPAYFIFGFALAITINWQRKLVGKNPWFNFLFQRTAPPSE